MKSEECSPRAEAVWAAHQRSVSDDTLMLLLSLWLPTYPQPTGTTIRGIWAGWSAM